MTESLVPARALRNGYIALIFGLVSIGFSAILIRVAEAPGTVSAFYRMAIGVLLVTIPFSGRLKNSLAPISRRAIALAILGGTLFGLDLVFWTTGIKLSGATNPTFMANTAPVWVGLGSLVIFREKQTATFWFGLILALAGAGLFLGIDLNRAAEFGLGTFYGLLAAMFYGMYMLVTQRGAGGSNALAYFWITTSTSAVLLLVVNLITGQPLTGYPISTYLVFLALGLVVQVFGWLIINFAQGYLPASIVSPTLLGQPILTAVIAAVLLGERFTPLHFVGGILVLGGVYLVHFSRRANRGLRRVRN